MAKTKTAKPAEEPKNEISEILHFVTEIDRLNFLLSEVVVKKTKDTPPVKPDIVEDLKVWADYQNDLIVFEKRKQKFKIEYEEIEQMIDSAKSEIIKRLPGNTWFKIGKYWLGYQTDDWPGSTIDLKVLLVENTPKEKLKLLVHQKH